MFSDAAASYGGGVGPGPGFAGSGIKQIAVEVDRHFLNHKKGISLTPDRDSIVVYPPSGYNPRDDHIHEGEICAQVKSLSRPSATGVLGRPAVVSNPSGLTVQGALDYPGPTGGSKPDEEKKKRYYADKALETVTPFGISRVTVAPNAPAGFMVQIGGIAQTWQTGEDFVEPGDIMYLDVPLTQDELNNADPSAPLTKRNWILKKKSSATPVLRLQDMTLDGEGHPGKAMEALLYEAFQVGQAGSVTGSDIRKNEQVQQAIQAYLVAVTNTFQTLRRLEFGTVVKGAQRGHQMLIKLA